MMLGGLSVLDMGLLVAIVCLLLVWFLDHEAEEKAIDGLAEKLVKANEALQKAEGRESFLMERLAEVRKGVGVTCPTHGTQLHCRACLGSQGGKVSSEARVKAMKRNVKKKSGR
jgi:hypothetical protein